MSLYTFHYPTHIVFGAKASQSLPQWVKAENAQNPLLVTDLNIAKLDFYQHIRQSLLDQGLNLAEYHDFAGNPLESHVNAGVAIARAHHADLIVALGGGAPLDVARSIALMQHHPGTLFDYEDEKPNARPIDQPIVPMITIPTTAGTGSEVGRSAVISEDQTHIKRILFSPRLLAKHVLLDPTLTLGLPPAITAATGLDALTHNVEAFIAKGFHPMADGIALEAIRIIAHALPIAYRDGQNLEARGQMLVAAMMGGVAFQKGLGANHSCAHALSAVYDMGHGLANGILLPYVMAFNIPQAKDRLARLAQIVNAPQKTPEGFVQWLVDLKASLNIPETLSQVGVKASDLDRLASLAFGDPCHPLNPRSCSVQDLRKIFEDAL